MLGGKCRASLNYYLPTVYTILSFSSFTSTFVGLLVRHSTKLTFNQAHSTSSSPYYLYTSIYTYTTYHPIRVYMPESSACVDGRTYHGRLYYNMQRCQSSHPTASHGQCVAGWLASNQPPHVQHSSTTHICAMPFHCNLSISFVASYLIPMLRRSTIHII